MVVLAYYGDRALFEYLTGISNLIIEHHILFGKCGRRLRPVIFIIEFVQYFLAIIIIYDNVDVCFIRVWIRNDPLIIYAISINRNYIRNFERI